MKRITLQIVFLFLMLSSFGQTHRLAILDLCERNAEINKENLASAIHMAEVAGMPYYITSLVEEAIQKSFILITSSLRDETLSSIERNQLIDFVRNGGIVIAPFIKSTFYFNGRDVFFYEGFATLGTSMQRIDLSVFSGGIYLMNFESETIQETLKLSINN